MSDTREDLAKAHNEGQEDYASGKDKKNEPLGGLLSSRKELEQERAYRKGWDHSKKQTK